MARQDQAGKLGRLGRISRPFCAILLAVCCALGEPGCTRNFFRKQADEQVSEILGEKDKYEDWRIEQFHVYPDPRARFADPTCPDHPPMPPDDPAAYDLSPNPQKPCKVGVAKVEGAGYLDLLAMWDAENRAKAAEEKEKKDGEKKSENDKAQPGSEAKPATAAPAKANDNPAVAATAKADGDTKAPTSELKAGGYASTILASPVMPGIEPKEGETRPYLLNLEQACELALINSREYQDARENLYLVALPVTLERFSFAAQFFAVGQFIRQYAGKTSPVGHQNNTQYNSNVGLSKLFPTGALLLANFANQTVFNYSGLGPKDLVSQSTINLSLVQPLLQGGGCAVVMEPLTQAERNLLYQIRDFARFRKELYVSIAGGGGGSITGSSFQPTGVIASPTFSPTAGIGASGLTPGVFLPLSVATNPGLAITPGSAGQLGLNVALAAPVSGYLSTLLQAAQMQVDRYNIEKLEGFFNLAKALQEGGDISQLQTDTFEQQLLGGRQKLLTDQQNYLQAIDQFKLQLGLPTVLLIELDDSPFRPLNRHFQKYEDLFKSFKAASEAPLRLRGPEMAATLRQELRRILTSSDLVTGTKFRARIETSWDAWQKLSSDDIQKRLAAFREERRKLLDKQTDLETKNQNLNEADKKRLDELANEIDLGEFEATLREYESQPWKNLADPDGRRRRQQVMHGYVVNAFTVVLIQARNERMQQIHEQWPVLSRVCVDGVDLMVGDLDRAQAAAAQHALNYRLDLMNVRAQVVDTWRQLAVYANALLGVLNVEYTLSSTTPVGKAQPVNFSQNGTNQQLIVNTQLPLVRVKERNNYRASLINYNRARRILQRAEDGVAYDVRQELIILRQNLENYKIQTRQVELAYLTVENSLDTLQAPTAPTVAGQNIDTATRAASLTNQLINAQTALYNAQFNMTTIWITFMNTRDQLYRDMELMPLDSRGVWIDTVEACECPEKKDAEKKEAGADQAAKDQESALPASQPLLAGPEIAPKDRGVKP